MRKANREVKDIEKIVEVMKKCEVCRIALNDEEYPYILPLSFGMDCIDGKVTLYFHSALEGTKLNHILFLFFFIIFNELFNNCF